MSENERFREFIDRIRAGDQQAAEDLFRQYEPHIRRIVRARLRDKRLRRVFDSNDVLQSLLGSFFTRAALDQYKLETPDELMRLLVTMVSNRVAGAARRAYRQRRDGRRNNENVDQLDQIANNDPTPSFIISGKELTEKLRASLSEDEQSLVELRKQGLGWDEIAEKIGGTAQARRMQWVRAMARVCREMGLEGGASG